MKCKIFCHVYTLLSQKVTKKGKNKEIQVSA